MDSASSVGPRRARGLDRVCHGGARRSRPERFDDRSPDLDDEYRNDRKRPTNRNRRALCLSLWPRDYLLDEILVSKEIYVAHLASGVCFYGSCSDCYRAVAPVIYLWKDICGVLV